LAGDLTLQILWDFAASGKLRKWDISLLERNSIRFLNMSLNREYKKRIHRAREISFNYSLTKVIAGAVCRSDNFEDIQQDAFEKLLHIHNYYEFSDVKADEVRKTPQTEIERLLINFKHYYGMSIEEMAKIKYKELLKTRKEKMLAKKGRLKDAGH
jgi:hypothetical protein